MSSAIVLSSLKRMTGLVVVAIHRFSPTCDNLSLISRSSMSEAGRKKTSFNLSEKKELPRQSSSAQISLELSYFRLLDRAALCDRSHSSNRAVNLTSPKLGVSSSFRLFFCSPSNFGLIPIFGFFQAKTNLPSLLPILCTKREKCRQTFSASPALLSPIRSLPICIFPVRRK